MMPSSPLAVVVFGVILFRPIACLYCLSTNDPATLVPLGLIYRRPGADLTLRCIANFSHETFSPGNYGPDSLFFTRVLRGEEFGPLPKTIANETVIETTVTNLTWEDAGRYVCKFKTLGNSEKNLCSSQLFVGLDPLPVEGFRCISNALENLDCWWTVPATVVANTVYKIGYRIYNDSRALFYECEKRPMESGDPSGPNRFNCTFKDAQYNALSQNLYFFIRATSPFHEKKDIPLPTIEFHNFRNVRPFAPGKVAALEVGRRNATIAWDITDKVAILKDENGLVHEISYQSSFEPEPVKVYVNTTRENIIDVTVRHTLENLDHPYTNYTVVIRSTCGQAEYDDLWSGFSKTLQFQTLPDIPNDVPVVPVGAYYFDSDGALTIYWEKVVESSHNGPNFRYVIDYADGHTSARKEANADAFAMKLNGTSRARAVNYSVSTINDAGMKQGEIVKVPSWSASQLNVNVKLVKPGHFLISWTPSDGVGHVLYYTIFYCEKKPPDEHNQRCKTQPERIVVNGTITSEELTLAEDKFYIFAVNSQSEVGASPLRWTTIDGGDLDSDVDYSLTIGLIIGGTVFVICVALAYPSVKWAKRKYEAFTKFPPIIVPKIDHEGAGGEKTTDWHDKRPPITMIGEKMGDYRITQYPPTPVLSRLTERFPTQLRDGLVRGIPKVDSHPYDMVDIYPKELEQNMDGSQSTCSDDEDASCRETASDVRGKDLSGSGEPRKKEEVPGYVVLGETPATAEQASPGMPDSTHYRIVGDPGTNLQQPAVAGYVTISPADYSPRPEPPRDEAVLDPSSVAFTVDVDVTVLDKRSPPPSPSNSRESDPGYVSATVLDEPPPPPMETLPSVRMSPSPSGYVSSF